MCRKKIQAINFAKNLVKEQPHLESVAYLIKILQAEVKAQKKRVYQEGRRTYSDWLKYKGRTPSTLNFAKVSFNWHSILQSGQNYSFPVTHGRAPLCTSVGHDPAWVVQSKFALSVVSAQLPPENPNSRVDYSRTT